MNRKLDDLIMISPGSVISYNKMCREENTNLQRGMYYQLNEEYSVFLMSLRPNAPYNDRVEEDGKVLIYEGHDIPKSKDIPSPKVVDQPEMNPSGSLTQNGRFYKTAIDYKNGKSQPEPVKVYEKIRGGIWVYNGVFKLVDAWKASDGKRLVFKFRLELTDEDYVLDKSQMELEHNRMIPSHIKLEVWKRDKGKCVICGSSENLHFDHIIPYSKGGSSLVAKNIQILCAKHNLEKRDKII